LAKALRASSILINATPVGMGDPLESPLSAEMLVHLPPNALVFEMVYAPPETALLRAARALGLRTATGLEMLLEQGAAAFQLWTGEHPPIAAMRAALALDEAE
jgi:shikimate dehydrogenase